MRTKPPHRSASGTPAPSLQGFTLVETLVALALMTLTVAVLTEAFYNTLRAVDLIDVRATNEDDIRFVRSTVIQTASLEDFEDGDEIETLNLGQAAWEAYVEETDLPDLFRVELTIEFENPEGEPFSHREKLYLLRPTWSEPTDRSSLLEDMRERIEDERPNLDF